MFVVWNEGGIKAPYVSGAIRNRKVRKVAKSHPVQRPEPHHVDLAIQGREFTSGHIADTYRQGSEKSPVDRKPAILARQIMTSPVVTLPMTASFSHAWDLVKNKRFRHVPVVSPEGKLVGILSDRDLFRATIEFLSESQEAMTEAQHASIDHIMVVQVLSATPETEIRAIARVFFYERIGAMPLVNDREELVGILTRSDILRTVVNEAPFELWV
ncbi:MAG: CBS domain-containing protein [Nitrospirales bacterium]|nr:CBS domain-containing protein [Nitrospira sp.]MDR4502533.1 CBS domain-containing protein [Nitrospirales bacterium]